MISPTSKPARSTLAEFSSLKPLEQKLLEASQKGEIAYISKQLPTHATNQNTVRASFLRFLALGGDEHAPVHEKGLVLLGAWVKDVLDLEGAILPKSLRLINCNLSETPILYDSNIQGIVDFRGCHVKGLEADRMVCSGSIFLNKGFISTGTVRLQGAQIGGDLECDEGKFDGKGDDALFCERAVIKGGVFLRNGSATGTVRLLGAQIGGALECDGGKFNSKSGDALNCERAVIKGGVFLRKDFTATGTVRLQGAQIHSNLDCDNGKFDGKGGDALFCERTVVEGSVFLRSGFIANGTVRMIGVEIGGNLDCYGAVLNKSQLDRALVCDKAVVEGSVFLRNGFVASGTIRLVDVQIGGSLECHGAVLNNTKTDIALACDRAVIKGGIFLRDSFTATGTVRLQGAHIGGNLECVGANFDTLLAEGITVLGSFIFHDLQSVKGFVTLAASKVGSLVDDVKSWPDRRMDLDGFIYDKLAGKAPTDAGNRLEWLNKQLPLHPGQERNGKDFKPQPWRQLQKVLNNMGHLEDARQVAIAFENQLRSANLIGQAPESWSEPIAYIYRNVCIGFHWLFGKLIGYGYRPLYLLFIMLAIWLVFGMIYWCAALNGVFAPSNPLVFQNPEYAVCVPDSEAANKELAKPASTIPPPIQGAGNWYLCKELREEYTGFSPLAYSLDLILPLVDLQQEHDWAPMIPTPKNSRIDEFFTWSPKHQHLIRFVMWFEILFGWMASLLLVAVVSGLTKRQAE